MAGINRGILKQVICESSEPVLVVHLGSNDWPVVLGNKAFSELGSKESEGKPFADVVEALIGRDLALEISETLRSREETSFPIEIGSHEFLLMLKPLLLPKEDRANYYAVYVPGCTRARLGSRITRKKFAVTRTVHA